MNKQTIIILISLIGFVSVGYAYIQNTYVSKSVMELIIDRLDRIEAKVNANKAEHGDFHTKLQSLGDSLKLHSTHEIIPTIPNPIGDILPYILIGGVFLLTMRRKRQ